MDIRQYRVYKHPFPAMLKGIANEESFAKSQKYNRAKGAFSLVEKSVSAILDTLFLACGGLGWLYSRADNLSKLLIASPSDSLNSVSFILLNLLINLLISMPFEAYKKFVIDEEYGFNKSPVSLFIIDAIKTLLITALIFSVIVYFLMMILQRTEIRFFYYLCISITAIFAAISFIFPSFIQPCFNKFKEVDDADLKAAIAKIAQECKFPLQKIYECDSSKRTAHSNAYLYGFWKNKRIVLFDTLKNTLSNDEICAVLYHEIGHWHYNHYLKGVIISLVHIYLVMGAFWFVKGNNAATLSFGCSKASVHILPDILKPNSIPQAL